MSRLFEIKQAFCQSKAMRSMVYVAALVMTVINCGIISVVSGGHGGMAAYLILGLSVLATLALYYVSDGVQAFFVLVKIAAKVGKVFTSIVSLLLCWMLFIGTFFAFMMSVLAELAVIAGALMFAYALPIVFIPVCHHLTRFAGYISKRADHRAEINNEQAYENAVN